MKKKIEQLQQAATSFLKRHEFKEGMPVRIKKELFETALWRGTDQTHAVFMYWLPNSFAGNVDHPLDDANFIIADCVVMAFGQGAAPDPVLCDSRYLEPIPEEELIDETPRPLIQ